MNTIRISIIFVITLIGIKFLYAQQAKISETQISLLTYPFSDPDPIPNPGKMYPYFRFDGYSAKGYEQKWKMIEMENDYIKLWIAPQIGGKIWGAIEKSTGNAFIYFNHVVKYRDVAMRGPWTSGGIEMNFGVIGHAPTSATPVDYFMKTNEDGSASCFVGAIDLPSNTRWCVEINLPKDKAYFTTRSVWDNSSKMKQSYYHWMNLGIKTAGNLEYVFPGNFFLGHDGTATPWPVDQKGRQISWYEKNNFGSYKSYHVFGGTTGFYGAYWHDDDFGFAHYSSYDDKPGKKVWIWGLSEEGMIWEKLLTDTDGQYTEIQSGRLFNQAAEQSSNTPFKNRGFAPGSTDEWTEYWFPVKKTKGLKFAVPKGSINLLQIGTNLNLWFCPNEKMDGILEVRKNNEIIFTKKISTQPMEVIHDSIEYHDDIKIISIWLDKRLLYDANPDKAMIKRPIIPAEEFNWETAYGWSLKGKEQDRQRNFRKAYEYYKKSIDIERNFVPSLIGLANLAYRNADYCLSLEYASKALAVDTYDGEANMNYGNASLALGDTISAIDGYSIAASSVSQRSVAYASLSSVYMGLGDYQKALEYSNKSLIYNQLNQSANQLKITSLRKLGIMSESSFHLTLMEARDPLNHFIRFERFISNPTSENKTEVQNHISNELPQETYLEYAVWYYQIGQFSDALKILELLPENSPIVLLWESYLNHLKGKQLLATDLLKKALLINPKFVFPFRIETLKPLDWAATLSNDWKIKYYEGLIFLNTGNVEKAFDLWKNCGETPDFYPFYIARTKLWNRGSSEASADVEKALMLAGNDWRTGLFASRFFLDNGNCMKSLLLAKDYYSRNPQNYYLALNYAKLLERNNRNKECVSLLQKVQVLPNEGATEGRMIWRIANIGTALDEMKGGKYSKALKSIEMAKQWPENLGVGKPYQVDERLEDYISLRCYEKLMDKNSVGLMQKNITLYYDQINDLSDVNNFFSAFEYRKMGNQEKGDQIIKKISDRNPSSKIVQWCLAYYSGNIDQAYCIAKQSSEEDRFFKLLIRAFESS